MRRRDAPGVPESRLLPDPASALRDGECPLCGRFVDRTLRCVRDRLSLTTPSKRPIPQALPAGSTVSALVASTPLGDADATAGDGTCACPGTHPPVAICMTLLVVGVNHRSAPSRVLDQVGLTPDEAEGLVGRPRGQRRRRRGDRPGDLQPGRGLRRRDPLPPGGDGRGRPDGQVDRLRSRRPSSSTATCTSTPPPWPTCSPWPPDWTRWWWARPRSWARCVPASCGARTAAPRGACSTASASGPCGPASGSTPRPASTARASRWCPSRSTPPPRSSVTSPSAGCSSSAPGRWAPWPPPRWSRAGASEVVVANRTTAGRRARRRRDPRGPRDRPRRTCPRRWPRSTSPSAARAPRTASSTSRSPAPPGRRAPRTGRWSLLDLALPHDVDPEVGDLPGVTRIDLASLATLPATAASEADVRAARAIVAEEVEACLAAVAGQAVEPVLVSLRAHVGGVLDAEMERLRLRLTGLDAARLRRGRARDAPRHGHPAAPADRPDEAAGRRAGRRPLRRGPVRPVRPGPVAAGVGGGPVDRPRPGPDAPHAPGGPR